LAFLSSCFLCFILSMAGLRSTSWTWNCHFFPRKCVLKLKWNPELRLTQLNQMHWTKERCYINRQPFVSWLRAAALGAAVIPLVNRLTLDWVTSKRSSYLNVSLWERHRMSSGFWFFGSTVIL
jgi:hypothetical protein